MSGIAGVYFLDGHPAEPSVVEAMICALNHRGADGRAVWVGPSVGLGCALLRNNSETAAEPTALQNHLGQLAVTADLRIDNRDELIAALNLPPSADDTVVLLNCYSKWGERCPERLLGDFSFAIWDGRRNLLFCGRDHFGIKPFYFYHLPGRLFAFASEIRGLLSLPEVPRNLNEVAVAELFEPTLEGYDPTLTFYREIEKLPAAHFLAVRPDGVSRKAYWNLAHPDRDIELGCDAAYEEAFRDFFSNAVRRRLRSTHPPAVLLSGGLDSAAVAAASAGILREQSAPSLHTLSAKHTNGCPESPYIDAVLGSGSYQPHAVRTDQVQHFAKDFDDVLLDADQPYDMNRHFASRMLYRTASEHGIRAVLDGVDGDAIASNEPEYVAYLFHDRQWRALASEIKGFAAVNHLGLGRVLLSYVLRPVAPRWVVDTWDRLHGRDREWGDTSLLNPDYVRRCRISERLLDMQTSWLKPSGSSREDQWRNLRWGHFAFSFEAYDRAASRFGIEPRHPFFDRQLIEFGLSLPRVQKARNGWSKYILRRSMAGMLPETVRWRTDKPNINRYLIPKLLEPKQELIAEFLGNRLHDIRDYVNEDQLQRRYHRYLSQGGVDDLYTVWTAVAFLLWLEGLVRPKKFCSALLTNGRRRATIR